MSSSTIDIAEFQEFLTKISSVSSEDLLNLLHVFEINGSDDGVACKFYLMRCEAQDIREDDFVQFLYDNIVSYTLSYADTHLPRRKLTKQQIMQYYRKTAARMVTKAEGFFYQEICAYEGVW